MHPISSCSASNEANIFFASVVVVPKCWISMLIIPIVCSTGKLCKQILPNALCRVRHPFFTFRLIPRKGRQWKFLSLRTRCASTRGTASVGMPYLIPGQSLNLYAIQPRRAERCEFLILLIHFLVFPMTFSSMCLESLPSTDDHTLVLGNSPPL